MTERPRRVVYVTYDGLEDPLGQSQVWPYVAGLARRGHRFDIVSFEKPGVPLRCRRPVADGIRWTALRYHRRPTVLATAFDLLQGLAMTGGAGLRRADLVHARSYVAAAWALPWARAARKPFLFDMRGLWADEKVDAGAWPAGGWLYRAAKRVERTLLRQADVITVLTHSMQAYLRDEYPDRARIRAPIRVIPTCTDLDRFSPAVGPDRALAAALCGSRILAYAGSLGTWYMAGEMARFYLAWREAVREQAGEGASTRFLCVSASDPESIRAVLGTAGVAGELVHRPARHAEVPAVLRCAEAALAFRQPTFSSRGGAPTKLGEALASGLPVAANAVGDVALVLRDAAAGVVVEEMTDRGLAGAARALVAAASRPGIGAEARRIAERWFSLDDAIDAYDGVYAVTRRRRGGARNVEDAGWPRTGRRHQVSESPAGSGKACRTAFLG